MFVAHNKIDSNIMWQFLNIPKNSKKIKLINHKEIEKSIIKVAEKNEERYLRKQIELKRFINAWVEKGTIEGTAEKLERSKKYVKNMISHPKIRNLIRKEILQSLEDADITPQRMASTLWSRLQQCSDANAAKIGTVILDIMRFCNRDEQLNDELTDKNSLVEIEYTVREP